MHEGVRRIGRPSIAPSRARISEPLVNPANATSRALTMTLQSTHASVHRLSVVLGPVPASLGRTARCGHVLSVSG